MPNCGISSGQNQAAGTEQSLTSSLGAAFNQNYSQQEGILQQLNQSLSPIVSAGVNQQGFSPAELASLNTQAIDTTGASAAAAERNLNNQLAGRGGSSGLESGVDAQLQAGLLSNSAGQLANEQNQITQANYNQGRQNYYNALGGLSSVSSQENPLGYAGLESSTNQNSFQDQTSLQNARNQKTSAIAGGIAGLALDAATGGLSGIPGLGSFLPTGGASGGGAGSSYSGPAVEGYTGGGNASDEIGNLPLTAYGGG